MNKKSNPFLTLPAMACSALLASGPATAQVDPSQFVNQFESTFG